VERFDATNPIERRRLAARSQANTVPALPEDEAGG